jgi:hypothetical protein
MWIELVCKKLLTELKFMSIHQMEAEHLTNLSDAFAVLTKFHKPDTEERNGPYVLD